jgi:hypothetical protein
MSSILFIYLVLIPSFICSIITVILIINNYDYSKKFLKKWQEITLILIALTATNPILSVCLDPFINIAFNQFELIYLRTVIVIFFIIILTKIFDNYRVYILKKKSLLKK